MIGNILAILIILAALSIIPLLMIFDEGVRWGFSFLISIVVGPAILYWAGERIERMLK